MFLNSEESERLGKMIMERDTQSRIASFLIGIKRNNAMVLSKFEWQPVEWIPFALLHGQLFREMELIGLLQHFTAWSTNPMLYLQASGQQYEVFSDLKFSSYVFSPAAADLNFYRYLALSQGLYAHLRFIRLLPIDVPLEHKFLALLRSLETIHGQQMQGQIQMLRHFPVKLSAEEREIIVGEESERVMNVFKRFVGRLLDDSKA